MPRKKVSPGGDTASDTASDPNPTKVRKSHKRKLRESDHDDTPAWERVNPRVVIGALIGIVIGFIVARVMRGGAPLDDASLVAGSIVETNTRLESLAAQFNAREKKISQQYTERDRTITADFNALEQRVHALENDHKAGA